jgi:hypothetical protein
MQTRFDLATDYEMPIDLWSDFAAPLLGLDLKHVGPRPCFPQLIMA